MKIDSLAPKAPLSSARVSKKTASDSPFSVSSEAETTSVASTSSASALSSVEGIMSLQEVSLDEPRKRKLVRAGEDVLEALDHLHALLLGDAVTADLIATIQEKLEALKKLNTTSAHVTGAIVDIELRAAVELAKLMYAKQAGGR